MLVSGTNSNYINKFDIFKARLLWQAYIHSSVSKMPSQFKELNKLGNEIKEN
jgi:hypothetical protein